ncbi:iron-sulfur cluster assembly scaffold protein [Thermodesulfobacteriota bacterium]
MSDSFDEFADNLQDKIYSELRKIYSSEALARWINPDNIGPIENPDAHGRLTGRCGDTMEIFLDFQENRVKKATYMTDGCASSNMCGSFAAAMAMGKNPDELAEITGETILNKIGRLPEEDTHCAFLAAQTLHEALDAFMKKQMKNKRKLL